MKTLLVNEDLGKVNRRAKLHIQVFRMPANNVPILPRSEQMATRPTADNRFFGEGYYSQTETPAWYISNPVYFPKWKKIKGYQK
ncbi:hypothetical protein [uncultured Draconibacterium sp.]|uniref:hypothetical protein n=1 Tax=uncultured Draconibacterium sp. TaxID=1573823 RepID=UPI0032171032